MSCVGTARRSRRNGKPGIARSQTQVSARMSRRMCCGTPAHLDDAAPHARWEAAGYRGMSEKMLEAVYGHHSRTVNLPLLLLFETPFCRHIRGQENAH